MVQTLAPLVQAAGADLPVWPPIRLLDIRGASTSRTCSSAGADTPSPFVTELVAANLVQVAGGSNSGAGARWCARRAAKVSLRLRQGPYGEFWGCSAFPGCRYASQQLDHQPGPEPGSTF